MRSKNVDSWISEHDPAIRQIAEVLREAVLSAGPELYEAIKWSSPVYSKGREICYLTATEEYVTLGFFDGTILTDRKEKFGRVDRKARHVKFGSVEDIDVGKVTHWVRAAINKTTGHTV